MKNLRKILALATCAAMAITLAACTTAPSGDADKTYVVGIVQTVQHEALDAATRGFRDVLTEKLGDKVSFNEQNAQGDIPTNATIANGLVSANVDLLLANATPSLQAAAAATADIPVLGTSITEYGVALNLQDFSGTVGGNVSGTSDLAPLDQQAAMIQEIFPDAQTVGLLYCSAEPNSLYQVETVKTALEGMGYTCTMYPFADSNDLAAIATTAANASDVIYVPTDNTVASNTGIIDNICRPAGVPVVAGEKGIATGCGTVTLSIDYYDLGRATGEMAYKILMGEADISTMPIEYAPNFTKMYNAEICEALGVTVPEGYVAID
jgi:putative ABC transport system substrate-binding protein